MRLLFAAGVLVAATVVLAPDGRGTPTVHAEPCNHHYPHPECPRPHITTTTTLPPGPTSTTSTTNVTTTTVGPSTTLSPPSGGYVEDFASPSSLDGFDHGWSGLDPSTFPDHVPHIDEWNGDHDMSCGAPTTLRRIHVDDKAEHVWWCAPGGPSTGHVMIGINTSGYNIAWLSPRRWFRDVSRVCWDQALNQVGGGKWAQVVLAARVDVERVQAQLGRLDLGFTGPGFQVDGGPTTGVHPTAASGGAKLFQGGFQFWRGGAFTTSLPGGYIHSEKATRFRHCMVDNGNGTVTLTQQRPSGTVTHTGPGRFPDGDVRVVWQDDNYDPPKREHYDPDSLTWHFDNLLVS